MMQINGINPVKPLQPSQILSPIQPIKAKRQDELQEQAAQMQPMFTAPMYMYPMQPMYMMPQQQIYGPQMMPQPFVANNATNPIKAEQQVTPQEALRAQALQPKITLEKAPVEEPKEKTEKTTITESKEKAPIIADKKSEEPKIGEVKEVKDETKPEDVVLKAEEKQQEEAKVADKKKPEIVAPEKLKPQMDLNKLIEILTSTDYDEQANGMEAIAQISKLAPEKADELLDVKVVDTLIGIMSQDTSKVPEADRALAQRNKEYAMYTTAILQKVYADGVKKVANTEVPMEDVVGMAGIVNELKNDTNPSTKEAALASLSYVKRPEYKEDLKQLFTEASKDIDPAVKQRAEKELSELA